MKQLEVRPIVKYTALSLFADRFLPSLPRCPTLPFFCFVIKYSGTIDGESACFLKSTYRDAIQVVGSRSDGGAGSNFRSCD